jgi:hypothetical protein
MMFNGLFSVVAYLCALDGLSNVMDVSHWFEAAMLQCRNAGMQDCINN